jgi:hypothetical protein
MLLYFPKGVPMCECEHFRQVHGMRNMDNFRQLLWSGWVLFVICWPTSLFTTPWVQICAVSVDSWSFSSTGRTIWGRLWNNLSGNCNRSIDYHTTTDTQLDPSLLFKNHGLSSQNTYTINNKFWEELIAYFPWYDTDRIQNDASNNYSIVARAFVVAATFLSSCCLATIGEYAYRHTVWW